MRAILLHPIKLEFGASVGFIHKESVKMHGHTIVRNSALTCVIDWHETTSTVCWIM